MVSGTDCSSAGRTEGRGGGGGEGDFEGGSFLDRLQEIMTSLQTFFYFFLTLSRLQTIYLVFSTLQTIFFNISHLPAPEKE